MKKRVGAGTAFEADAFRTTVPGTPGQALVADANGDFVPGPAGAAGDFMADGSVPLTADAEFSQGSGHTLSVATSTTPNAAGGALTIAAGDAEIAGTGDGGALTLMGGEVAGASGTGGGVEIIGGFGPTANGPVSVGGGNSGTVSIGSGTNALSTNCSTIHFAVAGSDVLVLDPGKAKYIGATVAMGTAQAAGFTASLTVTIYNLTADTLAIVLDDAAPIGATYEFWSVTGTGSPGHTFTTSTGQNLVSAGFAPAASFTWRANATCTVAKKYSATLWVIT